MINSNPAGGLSHRRYKPKVTKADYERAAEFLCAMGLKPTAVELGPDSVKITISTDRNLTLPADHETLDQEMAQFRATHGYG
jgi:hypothetical protein